MPKHEARAKKAVDPTVTPNEITEGEQQDLDNRFTYHAPKGTQAARYESLRGVAKVLAETITQYCPPSRERALALTNLEQASMWANASIARNE